MENLCCAVQGFDYGEAYPTPKVFIISPIHIGDDMERCPYVSFDETAPAKSRALAPYFKQVAEGHGCLFLDASAVARASSLDQLHMDAGNHGLIADAIADTVKDYFKT